MTILDRYIARQFLLNIVLLFAILFALVLVADFSLQFDEYNEIAEKMIPEDASLAWLRKLTLSAALLWDLWWPRLFLLFNYMLGLVLIGAAGFTCSQMVRHRELVAILAGGLSLHRVARPLLLVALAITLVQAANRELVIPQLAGMLTREKGNAGQRGLGLTRQPLTTDAQGRLFYARSVDLDRQSIDGLWVWERNADGLMSRRIAASRAVWGGDAWVLEEGVVESRAADGAMRVDPISRLETDLDPIALRLRRFEGYANNLSTPQVGELLSKLKSAPQPPLQRIDSLERNIAGRAAAAACNMLAMLVCLPFFLRREPTNMLTQAIKCAPVAIIALMGAQLSAAASVPGLPPQISVFVPAMVLVPLAIAAVSNVRT